MANMIMGLRIAGTKQRQAGFAPLVNVGVLGSGEGDNMDRVTMVAEKPAYVIKHTPDHILYMVIDRRVRSFDADAPGVLSIALTIPKDAQLAEGKSPYTLLKEVYQKFVSTYMEPQSDGRDSFINTDNDSEIFRAIVNNYSLEPRRTAYIPMNPNGLTGVVCVPEEHMEAFFCNTQYREFADFKDIEVGHACMGQVSVGLEHLQIPLPPASYDVFVNDKPTGYKMQAASDVYVASPQSTDFYDFEGVEFTLAEVMAAAGGQLLKGNSRIAIDYVRNRIYCTLKKIEVMYDFQIDWKDETFHGKDQIMSMVKKGTVRFMYGAEEFNAAVLNPEKAHISAINVKDRRVRVSPMIASGYSIQVNTQTDKIKRLIIVTITIKEHIVPQKPIVRNDGSGSSSRSIPTVTKTNLTNETETKETSDADTSEQPEKKKKSVDKRMLIFGLGGGLIIGALLAVLVILFIKDDKKPQADGTPNPTEIANDSAKEAQRVADSILQAKEIADKAAEAHKQDSIEKAKKDADEKAKKDAEEKARREQLEKEKAMARPELLALVNKGDLSAIRNYKNVKQYLSKQEMSAVEAVLNLGQYQATTKGKVQNLLKTKKPFKSFEAIVATQREIWTLLKDEE